MTDSTIVTDQPTTTPLPVDANEIRELLKAAHRMEDVRQALEDVGPVSGLTSCEDSINDLHHMLGEALAQCAIHGDTPDQARMPEPNQPEIVTLLQQAVVDIDRLQGLLTELEDTELFPDKVDFGNAREVLGSINSLKIDLLERIGELSLGNRMDGDQISVKVERAMQVWRYKILPSRR